MLARLHCLLLQAGVAVSSKLLSCIQTCTLNMMMFLSYINVHFSYLKIMLKSNILFTLYNVPRWPARISRERCCHSFLSTMHWWFLAKGPGVLSSKRFWHRPGWSGHEKASGGSSAATPVSPERPVPACQQHINLIQILAKHNTCSTCRGSCAETSALTWTPCFICKKDCRALQGWLCDTLFCVSSVNDCAKAMFSSCRVALEGGHRQSLRSHSTCNEEQNFTTAPLFRNVEKRCELIDNFEFAPNKAVGMRI